MNEKIKELEKDKLEIKKKEYQNRKDEDFQEKNEEDNEFAIKKDFNEKDFYQSIIIGNEILQSQINELKENASKLEDSLENEKTERQKLAIELSNLKTVNKNLEIVNQKLVNDLAKEKAERVDFQNQLMISFDNQFNEIMNKMKEEHKKQKEEFAKKFPNNG